MKPNKKWTYPILFIALLSMVFMGSLTPTQKNRSLSSVAARVDGNEIPRAEFLENFHFTNKWSQQFSQEVNRSEIAYATMRQLVESRALFHVGRSGQAEEGLRGF